MWDERYAAPGFFFGTEPAQFLLEHKSHLTSGDKALAVADGEGRNSVYLAKLGLNVTATDFSEVALKKARGLAKSSNVEVNYQFADLETWTWEADAFDLVVAIFIQFAGPEFRDQIFGGLQKTLRPGGTLLLHGYTPKQIEFGTGGPPFVENMYTKQMLKSAFSNMEILHLKAYEREVDEGAGHSGMSALIDLVARKSNTSPI